MTGSKSLAAAAFAATILTVAATQAKTDFPHAPVAAVKTLKASVGKQFNAGWVFVDGKYIDPPYQVKRYGNVIKINDVQVTGEVVPWSAFIKTQDGVKVTKTPSGETGAEPEAAPAAEAPVVESADDSWEDSLDDLFDDGPAVKKPAKKQAAAPKPRPKKPSVTVSYTFDGEFVHNDITKGYLERINRLRTKIDGNLRSGGCYFFSSEYPMVAMDAGAARHVLEHLPEIMKQSFDRETFAQKVHAASMPFSEVAIDQLFKNRVDHFKLAARLRRLRAY